MSLDLNVLKKTIPNFATFIYLNSKIKKISFEIQLWCGRWEPSPLKSKIFREPDEPVASTPTSNKKISFEIPLWCGRWESNPHPFGLAP